MQSLWMILASVLFSLMGVCVKFAAPLYNTAELVMYRSGIGVLMVCGFVTLGAGHQLTLRTQFAAQHAWRSIAGVASLWLWFMAIAHSPLATAVILNYTSPIWIAVWLTALAWFKYKTKVEWTMVLLIFSSFIGIGLLLAPSIQLGGQGGIMGEVAGLVSGVLSSFAYLAVKKLGQTGEPAYRIVFYFSAGGLLTGGAWALFAGLHTHTVHGLLLLLGMGVSATLAQAALTRAFSHGKTLLTANLQYLGVLFASFWGVFLFNDVLSPLSWLGMAVVVASGIAATAYTALKNNTVTEMEE